MDNIQRVPQMMKSKNKRNKRKRDDSVKVVYISSPMKVKTSASRFRTLVQELTGQDSDIARLMEVNGGKDFKVVHDQHVERVSNDGNHRVPSMSFMENCFRGSPTSSGSLEYEQFDDHLFSSQMEEQFMFLSDFHYDSSQIDVLGSYDDVL